MAAPLQRLVLASGNAGKLREFASLLEPLGITLLGQRSLGITDAEEPYGTFLENALAKARHASAASGLPALADDSGLCVDALGGAPGVHSARWAELAGGPRDDLANNLRVSEQLRGVTDIARKKDEAPRVGVAQKCRLCRIERRPCAAEDAGRGRGHLCTTGTHRCVSVPTTAQKRRASSSLRKPATRRR